MCRSQYLRPLTSVEKAKPESEVGSVVADRAIGCDCQPESEVGSVSSGGAVRIGCRLKSGGNAGRPARAHLIRMLSDEALGVAQFRPKLNQRAEATAREYRPRSWFLTAGLRPRSQL